MAENLKKSETSSERYERLLRGEIDADQYVKALREEARVRYLSGRAGRYAARTGSGVVVKRANAS